MIVMAMRHDGSNDDVNGADVGGESKVDCGENVDDSSRDSNDNGGVETNDEDDADFGDGKIKVDFVDDSDGDGGSDTIDDGGVNEDNVVDTNSSNNPDCTDSKNKVAINEALLVMVTMMNYFAERLTKNRQ